MKMVDERQTKLEKLKRHGEGGVTLRYRTALPSNKDQLFLI